MKMRRDINNAQCFFFFIISSPCFFPPFFLYIYDLQFTKENKIYNHQVHLKYMYLREKIKIKKRIKNALNNIKVFKSQKQ